jgi:hypothetical protein
MLPERLTTPKIIIPSWTLPNCRTDWRALENDARKLSLVITKDWGPMIESTLMNRAAQQLPSVHFMFRHFATMTGAFVREAEDVACLALLYADKTGTGDPVITATSLGVTLSV